ncbi:4-oxalocrotonate tautomerase [Salinisphaera sp. S4-8]|uniref:tautomerase family protein n=1 Tax=Salinisphaera sp. S4-8 TaxID=633357 RepID=UPI00333EA783
MPYLSFHVSQDVSRSQAQAVPDTLTELTATLLGKKRELTAVEITCAKAGRWYVGAQDVASQSQVGFYLEIKVTEGTNTKGEKAQYIDAVFAAVAEIFGDVAPASYIVIHEVHADAWGYAGQTQEYRYIRGKSL